MYPWSRKWPGVAWVGEPLPDSGCAELLAGGAARRASLRRLLGGKRAALLHFFNSG